MPENKLPEGDESDPIPDLAGGLEVGSEGRPAYGVYGLPSTCDVFEPNPETMARQEKKGIDTKIDRIYIYRLVDGKHDRIPGQWSPEEVNTEFLERRFGPGSYYVRGVNRAGVVITQARQPIGFSQQRSAFGGNPTGTFFPTPGGQGSNNQPPQNMLEALMFDMLKEKLTGGGAAAADPMRGAMADMMKMQALQTQSMMQMLQHQVTMKKDDAAPGNDIMKAMLVGLMGMVKNGNKGGEGNVEQAMGMMQMGMQLGRQLAGGAEPKQDPDWLKAFSVMAESFGPSLAAIAAQALPDEEKRKAATDAITEHMKARRAEAEADAATIDVDGVDDSAAMPDLGKTGT